MELPGATSPPPKAPIPSPSRKIKTDSSRHRPEKSKQILPHRSEIKGILKLYQDRLQHFKGRKLLKANHPWIMNSTGGLI